MITLMFVCKGLRKRTCPCCEGSDVAEKLGTPKDQQECHCGKFVKDMPRERGVPKYHTCLRQLGGAGTMFVQEDQPDTLHITIRVKEMPSWEAFDEVRKFLEARHQQVMWAFGADPGEDFTPPMPMGSHDYLHAAERPPEEDVEEPHREEEPRPIGVKPEDLPTTMPYRGPSPEEQARRLRGLDIQESDVE